MAKVLSFVDDTNVFENALNDWATTTFPGAEAEIITYRSGELVRELRATHGDSAHTVLSADAPPGMRLANDPAFNCAGTGDEAILNTALSDLGATGGKVVAAGGTFNLAYTGDSTADTLPSLKYSVIIPANLGPVELRGAHGAIFKLANGQPAHTVSVLIRGTASAKRTARTLIAGIDFDGNQANQTNAWTDFGTLNTIEADNVVYDLCIFRNPNFTNCLTFKDSWDARAYRCTVYQPANVEGAMRFESPRGLVEGCHFYGDNTNAANQPSLLLNANTDINVRADGVRVIGNMFVGGKYAGLAFGGVSRSVVMGNVFRDFIASTAYAVQVNANGAGTGYESTDNLLIGNQFYNIRNGILFTGSGTLGVKRNKAIGNLMVFGPDVSFGLGIGETGGTISDYNEAVNNTIVGASSAIGMVNTNSKKLSRGNRAYDTSYNIKGMDDDGRAVTTVTSTTYTATLFDQLVLIDATSNNVTVTLPGSNPNPGKVLVFKRLDASANTVTIQRAASETIEGGTSKTLSGQWSLLRLISNGSGTWLVG